MLTCPHCNIQIRVNELPYEGLCKSFRKCPECGGYFTADTKTKRRQAIFLFMSVISLALTLLLYYGGTEWLIPAIISYVICGITIYIGNKRIYFVPYHKDQSTTDDT